MANSTADAAKPAAAPALFPILLVNFIGTLGFSIVLPFLVFLVTRFGGNALMYGVLGAVYPTFQLIGAPILGKWSDIYGRRNILLLSQAGTLLSWFIFVAAFFVPLITVFETDAPVFGHLALTLPLIVLFVARALDGITGGNVSVANAYLADVTEDKDRSKNYGKMAVSSNLGFIIGPALAGLLGATALGELLPVIGALTISLVATLVIAVYLPESKPCVLTWRPGGFGFGVRKVFGQEQKDCFEVEGSHDIGLREVLRQPHIPYLLTVYFLVFLGFNFFYTAFPVHAATGLDWSVLEIGTFFAFLSVLLVIVQGPILGRLSKKFSDAALIVAGSILLAINFLLLVSHHPVVIYLAAVFFAVGNGIMWPSILSVLSKVTHQKYQGSVQGIASSGGSLASIIGLITGGILYTTIGSATFLVSGAIIFGVALLSIRMFGIEVARTAGAADDG